MSRMSLPSGSCGHVGSGSLCAASILTALFMASATVGLGGVSSQPRSRSTEAAVALAGSSARARSGTPADR
eukprot:5969992-Pleurochrysis_carterae.AAC.4